MSKKFIAGAGVVAGLAVALAPLATYAAGTSRIDTLQPVIGDSCTIVTPASGSATNTYTGEVTAGSVAVLQHNVSGTPATEGAENTITISCNALDGYRILAAYTDLTHTDEVTKINPGAVSEGTSFWALHIDVVNGADGNLNAASGFGGQTSSEDNYNYLSAASGNVVASKTFDSTHKNVASESFTVKYKVGASTTQKAGTYTGTVTYTLAQGQN